MQKIAVRGKIDEQGFVLVVALIVMLVATVVGIFAIQNTTIDTRISGNERMMTLKFDAADAAASAGVAWFKANFSGGGRRLEASIPPKAPVDTYFATDLTLVNDVNYNFKIDPLGESAIPPPGWDPHLYRQYSYRVVGQGTAKGVSGTETIEIGVSCVFKK